MIKTAAGETLFLQLIVTQEPEISGQGIVLCLGNGQFKFAATTIRILREVLKTELPIEVFFIREDDLSVAKQFHLENEFSNVALRKLDQSIVDEYTRFGGWVMSHLR
ncbi:unnamed protein product [Rhizopus stolonifer]